MENRQPTLTPGENTFSNGNATLPPKAGKRCALEPVVVIPGNDVSTPFVSTDGRKRLLLECDRTPFGPVSWNGSSRSFVHSTPNRTMSTTRTMSLTRGIQTAAVKTANRYCQVSVIPKQTASVPVQTDESTLGPVSSPAPPVVGQEIGCQTDEPAARDTCVGTTQTMPVSIPLSLLRPRCENAACQTDSVEQETAMVRCEPGSIQQQQEQEEQHDENGEQESVVDSISSVLNDIAKQYGIELPSPAKKRKSKSASSSKQMQAEFLQECLVKKTYRAVAAKLNEKLPMILEKQLTAYGRQTAASRRRLLRWAKLFIRQQQQKQQTARARTVRKVIVLKRRAVVRAPVRPVEEKAIQCDPEPAPAPAPSTSGVTVGTQWQRQKPPVTTVVKRKTSAARKPNKPKTPSTTDCKTCSADAGSAGRTRESMRQTKLSHYAQGPVEKGKQQQRKQQGECTPQSSKLPAAPVTPTSRQAKKTPTPSTTRKKTPASRKQKAPSVTEEIVIAETPSPPAESETKHLPYRSPPHYSSQCSKSTDTSFLTSSQVRPPLQPAQLDLDQPAMRFVSQLPTNHLQPVNPSHLVSPLGRMYVRSEPIALSHPPADPRYSNTFLVPINKPSPESVPATPQDMVYVNPPERRTLLRSRSNVGRLVREKPPEVSIISSQELMSQIAQIVEKAMKENTIPRLTDMYGTPGTEVFNGGVNEQEREDELEQTGEDDTDATTPNPQKQQQQNAPGKSKFVCSSANTQPAPFPGSQPFFDRPPFHTERSPSLSPIIYQDDSDDDSLF